MLDFKSTHSTFGKPVSVDLKLGLATAPVLYALEEVGGTIELQILQLSRCFRNLSCTNL